MKMNKIHRQRLTYVLIFLMGISVAVGLILYALQQNINAFYLPAQLAAAKVKPGYHFRLGGMVKTGSLVREKNSLALHFIVTDYKQELRVNYVGVLPDLFREGKGVIAEGSLTSDGSFNATQVLAKHDENYMPKNVYQALRANAVK